MAERIVQQIVLQGDSDIRQRLDRLGSAGISAFKRIGDTAESASRSLQRIGREAEAVGRSLSLYVTAPIVAMGTAAVASFASFEKSMSNVSTLVDTATEVDVGYAQAGLADRRPRAGCNERIDGRPL